MRDLKEMGVIARAKHGVKLLAKGGEQFSHKITIEVSDASKEAIKIIQDLGG